ncbi:MAG TPA: xanthine phosphoribosyltransferase [Zoogloea sp.]|uniref:xanthine phosphoribosyltransferase n=1 Tax=Zoogloea sp. TaxID=49181 RepID=UPI002BECA5B7|nr:xanthine phosphoribosyltransferase [Zoogloea sp.]HMV16409.1 xanthine phosphoribosyltransferase [Rhodocyclaceae bacterium]HMV61773.1 xanthine phosphoribosyltransferase [Rhodocyclaceae bacterium]HMY48396.1 xanthine phosphoribosyltransferase [Rhodocyclaceae bacterium]HMZ75583.1 xanthine phosphoribosyltransferase [Rhodocyclaceae bacterium]HNA66249.1 xanthine phosphoribosyltransferase [Rhodocyclaceae bacterium]
MERSPNSPYRDDIVISWPELHRDTRLLCHQLMEKGPFKGIIAIARGGLIPAALVARELEIRLIDTICAASYEADNDDTAQTVRREVKILKGIEHDGDGYLLIDDLVDTGNTARVIRAQLPKAYFATLYAKPMGRQVVDLCIKEFSQDKWIYFPWDIDYQFVPPIKKHHRPA